VPTGCVLVAVVGSRKQSDSQWSLSVTKSISWNCREKKSVIAALMLAMSGVGTVAFPFCHLQFAICHFSRPGPLERSHQVRFAPIREIRVNPV